MTNCLLAICRRVTQNSAMFGFGKKKKSPLAEKLSVQEVTNLDEFENLVESSHNSPVFLLKHSTRCPISKWAFDELVEAEKKMAPMASFAYLDLIAFREVSNFISHSTGIKHESPQLFYIAEGQVRTVLSHQDVKVTAMEEMVGQN